MLSNEERFRILHSVEFWKGQLDTNPAVAGAAWSWDESLDGPTSSELVGGLASDTGGESDWDSELLAGELRGEEVSGADREELPGTGARVGRMRDLLSGSLGPEQMGEGIAIFRAALAEARSAARREAAA